MVQVNGHALGVKAASAATHSTGIVCKSPVLSAACDLLGLRVDRHHAAAGKWSKVWPAIRNWLQEPVPEHDIDTGEVVGERPRWQAIAPYVGIPIATAAIFGLEAYAPAIAAWLGLGGGAAELGAEAGIAGPRFLGSFPVPKDLKFGTTKFGDYAHEAIVKLLQRLYPDANFIFRVGRGQ